jgi:non-ribosomal peptide synthetase component F
VDGLITRLRQTYSGEEIGDNSLLLQTYLYNATTDDTMENLQEWRSLLAGVLTCTFPTLTAKPDNYKQLQSGFLGLDISRQQIHDFCIRKEVEPAYILQLAWALVLRAYVGMDQVAFGYEVSGRDELNLPGMKREIGSFASLLPCFVELAPNRTILECLQSLSEIAAIARQYQNPTMSEIHHAAEYNTTDLFNTCLSMRDFENARHARPELDAKSFRADLITSSRGSNNDLSLSTMFIDDRLHLDLVFRNMTATQAENIMHTFERATKLILEDSNRVISAADLFTDTDYAQLVVNDFEFNQTMERSKSCVHQLILKHSQTRPDVQAICSWDGNMTYHQMGWCVATLASYLRNIGVSPGLAVPVIMEKSKWAPVIMLAVLKAGGSIVCLDAQDRSVVEATIKQLGPRIVLATESGWNDIVCLVPNLVIVNERFFSILPPQVSIPVKEPTTDHGACIMYTPSKSKSGTSRSIFFTHSSLCQAFLAQGEALKMGKDSRVLQLSAFNVDIALVEILGTLVHGGCVCVPSAKERTSNLGEAMARMRVNWSYMTATMARRLDPEKVPDLKTLCFRTRRLDDDTITTWKPNRNILLAYGAPDVCPLGISIAEVQDTNPSMVIPPPLMGRFWILNPEDPKNLMPLGSVGELAIDCPTLTPHKFVPGRRVQANLASPADQPTRLRYLKTGHRVRYLDDGSIQFLSTMRDDTLDGSPIPIADIEQHLRRSLVTKVDVTVELVTTSDHVQILAAFLQLGDDLKDDSEDLEKLRKQTQERTQLIRAFYEAGDKSKGINSEHIPQIFIPLKQFPLSTSLKVNRRKLHKMVSSMSYTDLMGVSTTPGQEEFEEKPLPLTHIEERMRHVWSAVLDVPPAKIKSSDSFLSLGGNRFLASKLVIACRKSALPVTLPALLQGLTLTEVCQAIAAPEDVPVDARVIEPRAGSAEGFQVPGFDEQFIKDFVAPQLGVHRHDILDIAEASAHQIRGLETRMDSRQGGIKCLVFNFNGPIRAQKLQTACETLTRLHPIFRTGFCIHDRRVYQVLLDNFRPEFQRYPCPAWCLGSVADNVLAEDQDVEFCPEYPLTKFTFLDAGQQSTLIVRLTNSQIDEAAVSLFVQDLAALYEGYGKVSTRPNFFEYMRASQAANHNGGVDFWRATLEGAEMTQLVSYDQPYTPVSDVKTLRETIQIDPVSEFGLNFSTVLKAAWAITLAQYAACSDVVFGEVTQGPNIPLPDGFDMSSLLAPTTNIIPVRVKFRDEQDTPLDFMRPIQEQRAASRPHEALGILELVQRCTDWPYWTRFSTVVHHRRQAPVDGTTTLNMGDTTFTHAVIDSAMQDLPDMFVVSTMDGPTTVTLELKYSESRVPTSFAQDALRVLAIAVDMITNYDTIEKPMVQAASEISRSAAKIPLPKPPSNKTENQGSHQSLPHDERQILQSLISAVWSEVLNPKALGVPEGQLHKANFFDLWGSVLPAQAFADRINAEFSKQPIKGLHKLTVSAKDIIDHPSMAAQYELVVKMLTDAGILQSITRRKNGMSWNGNVAPASAAPSTHSSNEGDGWNDQKGSLRKSAVGKLKGVRHSGSVRGLAKAKAGDWVRRHRGGKDHDSLVMKGVDIGDPVPTELPPRAAELREQQKRQVQQGGPPTLITGYPTPNPNLLNPQQAGMEPSPMTPVHGAVILPMAGQQPQELGVSPVSVPGKRRSVDTDDSSAPPSPVKGFSGAWAAT